MDGFECISDETSNEIVLAQKAVKKYINGDKNRLLKLKAQALEGDYMKYYSTITSIISVPIAFISVILSIIVAYGLNIIWSILPIISFILYYCYITFRMHKFSPINSWRQYILVVIEEIEKTF